MKQKVQVWVHARSPENERWILLLKTNEKRGSFWQPVTGSVEEGETLNQAALREAVEETGLEFSGEPLLLDYEFRFEKAGDEIRETCFEVEFAKPFENATQLKERVVLDPKEHAACEWVQPEEVAGKIKFDSNREAWKRLEKRLKIEAEEKA